MIHPSSVGLWSLLLLCAAFGGNFPPLVLAVLCFATSRLKTRTPHGIVVSSMVWAVLQLIALVGVNIAATTSRGVQAHLFTDRALVLGLFGVHHVSKSNSAAVATVVIPQILLFVFCAVMRRSIIREGRTRRPPSVASAMIFGVLLAVAGVISPSILALPFFFAAAALLSLAAFSGGDVSAAIRGVAFVTSLYGVLALGLMVAYQNLWVFDRLSPYCSDNVGLVSFYGKSSSSADDGSGESLSSAQKVLHVLQFAVVAAAVSVGVILQQYEPRPTSAEQWLLNRASVGPSQGASVRSFRADADSAAPLSMTYATSARWVTVPAARAEATIERTTRRLLHFLLVVPVFPALCIAALVITFPALLGIVLLPLLIVAALSVETTTVRLPTQVSVVLCSLVLLGQVAIAAVGESNTPPVLLRIFFSSTTFSFRVVEVGSGCAVALILACACRLHVMNLASLVERDREEDESRWLRTEQEEANEDKPGDSVAGSVAGSSVVGGGRPKPSREAPLPCWSVLSEARQDQLAEYVLPDHCGQFDLDGTLLGLVERAAYKQETQSILQAIQRQETALAASEDEHVSRGKPTTATATAAAGLAATASTVTGSVVRGREPARAGAVPRSASHAGLAASTHAPQARTTRTRTASVGGTTTTTLITTPTVPLTTPVSEYPSMRSSTSLVTDSALRSEGTGIYAATPVSLTAARRCLITECARLAASPMYVYVPRVFLVLCKNYSTAVSLLFVYAAATSATNLTILRCIELLFFLVFLLFPQVAKKYWVALIFCLITTVLTLTIMTFVSRVNPSLQSALGDFVSNTVGIRPWFSAFSALFHYGALFVCVLQHQLLKGCWGRMWECVIIHEWTKVCATPLATRWRRYITMMIAGAVFVSVSVFQQKSLTVVAFLLIFLVISILATYGFPRAVTTVVWRVAVTFSAMVMLAESAYQLPAVSDFVRDGLNALNNGCINSRPSCQEQIGLISSSSAVLTVDLAPWFIALVTSWLHLRVDLEDRELGLARETRRLPPTAAWIEGLLSPLSFAAVRGGVSSVAPALGGTPTTSSWRHRQGRGDQRLLRFVLILLSFLDRVAVFMEGALRHYAEKVLWLALFIVALERATIFTLTYAIFFVVGAPNLVVVFYATCHLAVLYTYQFSFIPSLSATINGTDVAQLIGLIKTGESTPTRAVIGPISVVFAALLTGGLQVSSGSSNTSGSSTGSGETAVSMEEGGAQQPPQQRQRQPHEQPRLLEPAAETSAGAKPRRLSAVESGADRGGLETTTLLSRPRASSALACGNAGNAVAPTSINININNSINSPATVVERDGRAVWIATSSASADDAQPATTWIAFVLHQLTPFVGYEFLMAFALMAVSATYDSMIGFSTLLVVIALVICGRHSVLKFARYQMMFGVFFAGSLMWELLLSLNVSHSVFNVSNVDAYFALAPNTYFTVVAFLATATLKLLFRTRKLYDSLHMHNSKPFLGYATLIQFLVANAARQSFSTYRGPVGTRTSEAEPETPMPFRCIDGVRDPPQSCANTVLRRVTVFAFLSVPLAIVTFADGLRGTSVIHVCLIVGSALLYTNHTYVALHFRSVWRKTMMAYFLLPLLSVLVHIPPVAEWIRDNRQAPQVLGLLSDTTGRLMPFGPLRVLLFVVLLCHQRLYEEWSFIYVLRELRRQESQQASEHARVTKLLHDREENDFAQARENERRLREQLDRLRSATVTFTDDEEEDDEVDDGKQGTTSTDASRGGTVNADQKTASAKVADGDNDTPTTTGGSVIAVADTAPTLVVVVPPPEVPPSNHTIGASKTKRDKGLRAPNAAANFLEETALTLDAVGAAMFSTATAVRPSRSASQRHLSTMVAAEGGGTASPRILSSPRELSSPRAELGTAADACQHNAPRSTDTASLRRDSVATGSLRPGLERNSSSVSNIRGTPANSAVLGATDLHTINGSNRPDVAEDKPPQENKEEEEEEEPSLGEYLYAKLISAVDEATEFCMARSLAPKEPDAHQNRFYRLCTAASWAAQKQTHVLVFVALVFNFACSTTLYDFLPLYTCLVVAAVWYPWPPMAVWRAISTYLLTGFVGKALAFLIMQKMAVSMDNDPTPGFTQWVHFFNSILTPMTMETLSGDSVEAHNLDVLVAFVAYAVIVVHCNVSVQIGIYDVPRRSKRTSAAAVHPSETPTVVGSTARQSSGNASRKGPDLRDEHAIGIALPSSRNDSLGSRPGATRKPSFDGSRSKGTTGVDYDEDGDSDADNAPSLPARIKGSVRTFVDNVRRRRGTGTDMYCGYMTLDALALVAFVAGYYTLAGTARGSVLQSVRNNMLPGGLPLGILLSLISFFVDRAVYVMDAPLLKYVLHVTVTTAILLFFLFWETQVEPVSRTGGIVYLCLKMGYAFVSARQVRSAFPQFRAHDPFTRYPESLPRYLSYRLFRLVPFLWEARNIADWALSKTQMLLPQWLTIEDCIDIVYVRRVAIETRREDLAAPMMKRVKKVLTAFLLTAAIFLLVLFPLFYYSTFNPVTQPNDITSASVSLSIGSASTVFTSTDMTGSVVSNAQADPDAASYRAWLSKTRPFLASFGLDTTGRSMQFMQLSSCSSQIWTISPQAARLLSAAVDHSLITQQPMAMNLEVSLMRPVATGSSSNNPILQRQWTVPPATLATLSAVLNSTAPLNASVLIPLPSFFTPFIFNMPSTVDFFSGLSGDPLADTVDCSMQLRSEHDVQIGTAVRYWCVKCRSLFSKGNLPNDTYPEWRCLSGEASCSSFNGYDAANGANGTFLPMYLVVFSDSVPLQVNFLPNIGIVAIYTSFVLAIGSVVRGLLSNSIRNVVLSDMADPTPVASLLNAIFVARLSADADLEYSLYCELVDLLRQPDRLFRLTGRMAKKHRAQPPSESA